MPGPGPAPGCFSIGCPSQPPGSPGLARSRSPGGRCLQRFQLWSLLMVLNPDVSGISSEAMMCTTAEAMTCASNWRQVPWPHGATAVATLAFEVYLFAGLALEPALT